MEPIDLDGVEQLTGHVHKLLDHESVESAMSFMAERLGEHNLTRAMRPLNIATRQGNLESASQDERSSYWKWEPDNTVHPASSRDIIEILNFAILRVDIEHPVVDKSHLKEKVHALYGKGHEVAAFDQLFCQFGVLVDMEMSDWEIEPTETVIDKLTVNAEHIAEDHDLAIEGTKQLREPLDYIDMVRSSPHDYWGLNEDDEFDVEKPAPLLLDDVDLMIDSIVDHRKCDDFSRVELYEMNSMMD